MSNSRRSQRKKLKIPTAGEIVFLLIAFVLSASICYLHISSPQNKIPNEQNEIADIVFGLRIQELEKNKINKLDYTGIQNISIETWEIEYAQTLGTPVVLVSIDYIYISGKFLDSNHADQICIRKFEIRANNNVGTPKSLIKENLCNSEGTNYFVNQSTNFAVLLYNKYDDKYRDPYYFPFDNRSISAEITIEASLLDANQQELAVSNGKEPSINIYVVSQNGKDAWKLESYNNGIITFALNRPIMYPVLSVLLLIVIFIAILSLLLLVDDTMAENDDAAEAGYWEVAVGILGIWSIQEVLLPDFIEGPTIIGDIILALYVFLSLIILYIAGRSVLRYRKAQKQQKNTKHR